MVQIRNGIGSINKGLKLPIGTDEIIFHENIN
jgi:hypothetical protein